MLIKLIRKFLNIKDLKEDFRKMGINFVTAGFVGVFINHFVGFKISAMLWTSLLMTLFGSILLLIGLITRGKII